MVEGDGKQSAVTSDSFYGYEGAASADPDQRGQALSRLPSPLNGSWYAPRMGQRERRFYPEHRLANPVSNHSPGPKLRMSMTAYMPENMKDVRLLLGAEISRIPDAVPVSLGRGVQLRATVYTVGDLRKLPAWPQGHRLVIEGAPFLPQVRVELPAGGQAAAA